MMAAACIVAAKIPKCPGITPAALRLRIHYNPDTGEMVWLPKAITIEEGCRVTNWWNSRYAGKPALNSADRNGYKRGSINGDLVLAHRAAWALMYGRWPTISLDHIDGDPSNNRISNLREVGQSGNAKNSRRRNGTVTGVTGVYWHRSAQKYWATITVDGSYRYLGLFSDFNEAVAARRNAEQRYGFGPNHGRVVA